ncbi:MAG: hypothetical protein A3B68_04460 [Candidatus Melainabacteria bacterium RIFCSPHIGHO2_02_FULL_34_12]|nr:MAG: hypothetical protein A3B68_04460 [Candidatus Melainabacteria bacterium RIFCSPHIGHO2_02_FULL_34_12]
MINEYDKYRVQLFQIAGFSFFVPLGKVFIDIKDLSLTDLNLAFMIHIIASICLSCFGIILIVKGLEVLEREN